jgi:predicted peptidase
VVRVAAAAAKDLRPRSIESATLASIWSLLRTTQRRNAYETELRGLALLEEGERLAAWLEASDSDLVYEKRRPGSFRVRVPVGKSAVSCRLFVPKVEGGERPIVVALHGAGGSENLFFDGYGDGLCVDLAKARGWFVVSPRNGMGALDCGALVDELRRRYPIDLARVFVIGHSMGAMQAMRNVSATPGRFRAAAPIAGGGRVRASEGLAAVPFFVAAGARDFGRQSAQRLHRQLEGAGATAAWRLYPSVEHLAIVQVALPDVFSFFDAHAR